MTDLNLAYDQMNEYESSNQQMQSSQMQPSQMQSSQMQSQQQQQSQSQQMQSLPPPPPQPPKIEHFQMYQQPQQQNYNYQKRYPEYSFWDRMVMSKREVLKLFILSIVIILGISIEKIGFHYLTSYLSSSDLSPFQEFMVRLSFPIFVFLFLWIIKSL